MRYLIQIPEIEKDFAAYENLKAVMDILETYGIPFEAYVRTSVDVKPSKSAKKVDQGVTVTQ